MNLTLVVTNPFFRLITCFFSSELKTKGNIHRIENFWSFQKLQ
jgi:hypothetical protein